MLAGNNVCSFLAFLLLVLATPGGINAGQATQPKADPPRAGTNGVTSPQCLYCPRAIPQNDRDAETSGVVLLDVTVTADGRITKPVVVKGLSSALDESALKAVRKWKMKPALGTDGKPVNCRVQVEVTFHLYSNVATG